MNHANRNEHLRLPDAAAPAAARAPSRRLADYYELIKPRMNLLVLGTTAVGYYMAARGPTDWARVMHTLLGTALLAAGAAVLNQQVERRHDANMRRTARRPIAAGRIGANEALLLGAILAIVGLAELMLRVNAITAALGAATFFTYVFIYTPLKRITTLCTIVGAIPGALPTVMGWTAVNGDLPPDVLAALLPQAVALFGILFFWQLPHFLAIAILYKDDYAQAGFKMLPVIDKDLRATGLQIVVWSLALVPVTLLPSVLPGGLRMTGMLYFFAALLLGIAFTAFGVICAIKRGRPEARQLFFFSIAYLPLLTICMVIDKVAVRLRDCLIGSALASRISPIELRSTILVASSALARACDNRVRRPPARENRASRAHHRPGDVLPDAAQLPRLAGIAAIRTCMRLHPDGLPDEAVVIAADGAMANVFVYLKDATRSDGSAREPALLDQVGCQYVPHVVGVQIYQPLRVKNSDPVFHNVHVLASKNPAQQSSHRCSRASRPCILALPNSFARAATCIHG